MNNINLVYIKNTVCTMHTDLYNIHFFSHLYNILYIIRLYSNYVWTTLSTQYFYKPIILIIFYIARTFNKFDTKHSDTHAKWKVGKICNIIQFEIDVSTLTHNMHTTRKLSFYITFNITFAQYSKSRFTYQYFYTVMVTTNFILWKIFSVTFLTYFLQSYHMRYKSKRLQSKQLCIICVSLRWIFFLLLTNQNVYFDITLTWLYVTLGTIYFISISRPQLIITVIIISTTFSIVWRLIIYQFVKSRCI